MRGTAMHLLTMNAPVYIESLDEAKYNLPRDQIKFDPFAFRS